MRILSLCLSLTCAVACFGSVAHAGAIVILGQDPSYHWQLNEGQSAQLGANAVTAAAGGASNPNILAVYDGSFGENLPGMLAHDGFTNVTSITPGSLGSINLSAFQVIYFGPTSNQASVDTYNADSGQIANFVAGGGGLVVEPEYLVSGAFSFVPNGSLIGSISQFGDSVHITDPSNPVMAGLTDAGLSNWGSSFHMEFLTPAAGGFTTLATAGATAPAVELFKGGSTNTPEPSSITLFGLGACGLLWRSRRRSKIEKADTSRLT